MRNTDLECMLDRTYLVPEVYTEGEEQKESIEECIERLVSMKERMENKEEKSTAIEKELDTLFANIEGEKALSEMERVVVLLCKVAHKIMKTKESIEKNKGILLQIFEIGLLMVQFKNRWLDRIEQLNMFSEQGWIPCMPYSRVEKVFSPARELISLAQEYILQKEAFDSERCDICAFALANALGQYHSGVSLLLRQVSRTKTHLDTLLFICYIFAEAEETKGVILSHWLSATDNEMDGSVLYLSNILLPDFFSSEIGKIRDVSVFKKVCVAGMSHALIYGVTDKLFILHRKQKISTKEITDILSKTYTEKQFIDTEKIIRAIEKYSASAAETIIKSLVIYRKAADLSKVFFDVAFTIDKEYTEAVIICQQDLESIPEKMLRNLCESEYFSFLCREKTVFTQIVKCVGAIYEKQTKKASMQVQAQSISHGWNIQLFISQALQGNQISKETIEKALIMSVYFPNEQMYIRRLLFLMAREKGIAIKIAKKSEELEKDIEMLNCFREIPQVQKLLYHEYARNRDTILPILFNKEIDTFIISIIRKEIKKGKKNIIEMKKFLEEIKDREEIQKSSYWHNLIKKQIAMKSFLKPLITALDQKQLLLLTNNEEDIAYLLKISLKQKMPEDFSAALLEKLEAQTKYDEGLVFGSTSYICFSVETKKISAYVSLVQKEFAGRQSLIRIIGDKGQFELFMINGKIRLSYSLLSSQGKEEKLTQIEEDLEKHPQGGWKVSIALSIYPGTAVFKIGEFTLTQKHCIKRIEKIVLCEEFRGIMKRALFFEEKGIKEDRISTRPLESFFINTLSSIEKIMQYHKRFALLIESCTPYLISGKKTEVHMCNVFYHQPIFWRSSERLSRLISKYAANNHDFENILIALMHKGILNILSPIPNDTAAVMEQPLE